MNMEEIRLCRLCGERFVAYSYQAAYCCLSHKWKFWNMRRTDTVVRVTADAWRTP